MSRIIEVEQGTPEWLAARLGIPTASCFHQVMTPKTRKPSATSKKYLCQLAAERLLGFPMHDASSSFMQRGSELEEMAVTAYELERDCDTHKVGFIVTDDGRAGCSPDRLVGSDGLLEIKCPSAKEHVGAMLGYADEAHTCQCQGQLWVSGRAWVDLMFYNPALPRVILRLERDEEYISDLAECVVEFNDRLDEAERYLLRELGPAGLQALKSAGMGDHDGRATEGIPALSSQ